MGYLMDSGPPFQENIINFQKLDLWALTYSAGMQQTKMTKLILSRVFQSLSPRPLSMRLHMESNCACSVPRHISLSYDGPLAILRHSSVLADSRTLEVRFVSFHLLVPCVFWAQSPLAPSLCHGIWRRPVPSNSMAHILVTKVPWLSSAVFLGPRWPSGML